MNVITYLFKFYEWLSSLWSSLPQSTKDKIVEAIAESMAHIFRSFYQSAQNNEPDAAQ